MQSCSSDEVFLFPALVCGGYRLGGIRKNLRAINGFILFDQNFVVEKRIDILLFVCCWILLRNLSSFSVG